MDMLSKDAINALKLLENNDENGLDEAFKVLLRLAIDIRERLLKQQPEVFTQPTDNENDIIVGKFNSETGELTNEEYSE